MEQAEEEHKEDIPQDEPMNDVNEVDYDPEEESEESESSSMSSQIMARAHEIVNSQTYEASADEELIEGEESTLEQRPRIANRGQAKFINQFAKDERRRIDACCRQKEMQDDNI